MQPYDIAVIGAGPAGAAFSRLAAASGKRILLLDGQAPPRTKPCGGLLAPDAQKALAHLGLTLPKAVLVDPQIFSVRTFDLCREGVRYYPRHYLNVNRYAFDRWLLSLVPETVEIRCAVCTGVRREDGAFTVSFSENGEKTRVRAALVVGADGANSLVRRSLFGPLPPHYVAIQQWFSAKGQSPFYSCIFDQSTSESCSWSISKDGFLIFGGCFPAKGCRDAFERQKRRLQAREGFPKGECVRTEACLALSPRGWRDFVTDCDGAFLIGEAAGFISASSFEGISGALTSGSLLAEAFLAGGTAANVGARYRRKTLPLRIKLLFKVGKRLLLCTPFTRAAILRTGIGSIRLWNHPDKS